MISPTTGSKELIEPANPGRYKRSKRFPYLRLKLELGTSRRILSIVLGSLMVYVHMQALRFFGLILCLCIIISKYFWAFSIFRRWRHAWNPIETIAMDRINHAVTIRSLYFLTAPNNVEFSNKNVSEDIVDRMEWYGKPISYWRVWLYETDGGYKLIDQGHTKGPIQNLAADLAEVLHVPLLQIL